MVAIETEKLGIVLYLLLSLPLEMHLLYLGPKGCLEVEILFCFFLKITFCSTGVKFPLLSCVPSPRFPSLVNTD